MHLKKHGIRGEGKAGCFVGVLVLLVGIYVCFKVIPVIMATYEFETKIEDITRQAATAARRADEDLLRNAVLKEAERLNLNVEAKNIRITRGEKRITIEVTYTVEVVFPGYTWRRQQNPKATSQSFT